MAVEAHMVSLEVQGEVLGLIWCPRVIDMMVYDGYGGVRGSDVSLGLNMVP